MPRRLVERSITADALAAELDRIAWTRGTTPTVIRLDNGPEMIANATAEWVDWFNHRRLYEYCGDIPPLEAEDLYYARQQAQQQLEPSNQ